MNRNGVKSPSASYTWTCLQSSFPALRKRNGHTLQLKRGHQALSVCTRPSSPNTSINDGHIKALPAFIVSCHITWRSMHTPPTTPISLDFYIKSIVLISVLYCAAINALDDVLNNFKL